MNETPTVFVVDDNIAVRDAIRWMVEEVGLNTKTYSTASEFLLADAFLTSTTGFALPVPFFFTSRTIFFSASQSTELTTGFPLALSTLVCLAFPVSLPFAVGPTRLSSSKVQSSIAMKNAGNPQLKLQPTGLRIRLC